MIELTLPWPPSTNTVWRNLRGRTLLSKRGREFRRLVGEMVGQQYDDAPLRGRLSVHVTLYPPDRRKRDIDNYGGKALLDALTHAQVWADDEQIDRLTIIRGESAKGGGCLVTIDEVGSA